MKNLPAHAALLAATCLMLAGCTATPNHQAAPKPSQTITPSPTPTIDPGPVELTVDEAADRYLGIVCPTNATIEALTAAFKASEDEFLNGGSPDPAAVKAAAQVQMDSISAQTELFDDEYYEWPNDLGNEITTLRDFNISALGTLSTMVNAPDYESAYDAVWPDGAASQAAAQEIRYQLGIGADTSATCMDHRDKHAVLIAEKQEREKQLAAQSEGE
ncbi:hypothetical protein MUN74_04400 [Agromyces endophyticus]|uniref:hypothetical protein n=1 Tax=Agromyces sp. H17E-10 TaxID=2932244 RepID=UPI001FD58522|nr:hypothetical protein [Agromyces sp. H17E-10]UOQ90165.1 hypothetical protein MUN74_04400 [Agromyces sp. H17E-10]